MNLVTNEINQGIQFLESKNNLKTLKVFKNNLNHTSYPKGKDSFFFKFQSTRTLLDFISIFHQLYFRTQHKNIFLYHYQQQAPTSHKSTVPSHCEGHLITPISEVYSSTPIYASKNKSSNTKSLNWKGLILQYLRILH